jgi:hypothetical protein
MLQDVSICGLDAGGSFVASGAGDVDSDVDSKI